MKKHIIFDLDGTLIDSAPSILESFEQAFSSLKLKPSVPVTADVIGPPLMPTLAKLAGSEDKSLLDQLAINFKAHYDSEGYKKSTVYAGVQALLEGLHKLDVNLYVATNKRDLPTQKIMKHLNWNPFFDGVFALDTYSPPLSAKSVMVERIIKDFAIAKDDTIYIGDRHEDGMSADHNQIDFAMVTWGYADQKVSTVRPSWLICPDVNSLRELLICHED